MRLFLALALTVHPVGLAAQGPPLAGRWDLTVTDGRDQWPSWFEIVPSGDSLSGRFQGRVGHATPVTRIEASSAGFRFVWPSEGAAGAETVVAGRMAGPDSVAGTVTGPAGATRSFVGVRAPGLARIAPRGWGPPVDLLGPGLAGWRPRQPDQPNGWTRRGAVLANTAPGTDLISLGTFEDFRLEFEVRVPEGGNSGVYLRGRHEVQILADDGRGPWNRGHGGIYGQVSPAMLPARTPGQWDRFEVTLVGRRVTVVLNGERIIDRAEIPGITGGALDAAEGAPGPIMLQGDHTPIEYRNIRIRRPMSGPADPLLDELAATELRRFRAQVERDTAALRNLLAEDVVYTHSNGLIEDRDHFIRSVASGGIRYEEMEPVEIRHRVYGETAIGNGKVRVRGTLGGRSFAVELLFTDVLVRRDGQWRMASWQSTAAP